MCLFEVGQEDQLRNDHTPHSVLSEEYYGAVVVGCSPSQQMLGKFKEAVNVTGQEGKMAIAVDNTVFVCVSVDHNTRPEADVRISFNKPIKYSSSQKSRQRRKHRRPREAD